MPLKQQDFTLEIRNRCVPAKITTTGGRLIRGPHTPDSPPQLHSSAFFVPF